MPLVTIQFDLPAESDEHECAINGWKYKYVLSELDSQLRSLAKYADPESDEIKSFSPQKVRELLHNLLDDEGVSLD